MNSVVRRALIVLAVLFVARGSAAAQTNETAFSVERFVPAPGVGQFWMSQDASVLAHLAYSGAAVTSLMADPIAFQELNTGERLTTPVSSRLGMELLAAVGLIDRVQIGLGIPVIIAQSGDRLRDIDLDETELATSALGDVRLHGKVRIRGEADRDGFGLALAASVSLPTGDQDHFAGEKSAVFAWRFIASQRTPRWAAAVNLGQRVRVDEVVLLSPARPHGNEIVGSVAGEAVVYQGLSAVAEYAFVHGDAGPAPDVRGPSPAEFRGGMRLFVTPKLSVGAGLGWGTSPNEVGSPSWRLFASISWASTLERVAPAAR